MGTIKKKKDVDVKNENERAIFIIIAGRSRVSP